MENKYLQLQSTHQTLQQMQEHIQVLEKQQAELMYVEHSLGELDNVKNGSEILVQLSSGIFAKAEVKSIEPVFVNVGAGIVVEKTLAATKEIMLAQIAELQRVHQDLHMKFSNLLSDFQKMQEDMKELSENV